MTDDGEKLRKRRLRRIRRVRFFLKYMPRRATLHRYPFLKLFAESARKRAFFWSFRLPEAIPAIYAGSIISFLPLYGVQIPIAFFAALVFRANLMILVGLQFITNPLTIVPIYGACYWIGDVILNAWMPGVDPLMIVDTGLAQETVGSLGIKGKKAFHLLAATSVGGLIVGYIFAFIASISYRIAAKKASIGGFLLGGTKVNRKAPK